MPMRTALTRLAIVTAAGALAASAAVTPALADGGDGVHAQQGGTNGRQNEGDDGDDWRPGGGDGGGDGGGWQSGGGNQWQSGGNQSGGNQNGNQSGGNQWQSGGNGNQWQSGGNGNQWQSGGNGNQWQSGGHQNGNQSGGTQSGGNQWQSGGDQSGGNQSGDQNDGRLARGRVTADELLLRSAPTRASQVIRVALRGEIVSIFCRTAGQDVQGNPHWYLLTDGTWAWGSARYIETIGAAPRWC